jgi:hypothetical protein
MKKQVVFWEIRAAGLAVALLLTNAHAAEVRHLTLDEAVQLGIKQNRSLKIVRLKVEENRQKKAQDHSAYFPTLTNQSHALHLTELQKGVTTFRRRRSRGESSDYGKQAGSLATSKRRPMEIPPGFDSVAAREFLLGKVRKREPRQSFQSYEKRSQLVMLLDCGAIQRHHFWVKL